MGGGRPAAAAAIYENIPMASTSSSATTEGVHPPHRRSSNGVDASEGVSPPPLEQQQLIF